MQTNFSDSEVLFYKSLIRPIEAIPRNEVLRYWDKMPDKRNIRTLAEANKVVPVIIETIQSFNEIGLSGQVLCDEVHIEKNKTSQILTELDHLSGLLEQNEVSWIVLENGAVARGYYQHSPHLFSFGDLDLLIKPESLSAISKLLFRENYSIYSRNEGRVVFTKNLNQDLRLRVNLQSSFVARKWFDSDCNFELDEVFSNSKTLDSKTRILLPEYFILQLCIHSASHSFIRKPGIRLHMDIDWFLRSQPVDWDRFADLVKNHSVRTTCYFALIIPKMLFDTPIPDKIIHELAPSKLKKEVLTAIIFPKGRYALDGAMSRWQLIEMNLLLADNLSELWRMIFPDRKTLEKEDHIINNFLLPYYYIRRIGRMLLNHKVS